MMDFKLKKKKMMDFTTFRPSELKEATNDLDDSLKIRQEVSGSFCKGSLEYTTTGAIKIYTEAKIFNRELEIHTELRHPNIITLIGANLEDRVLIFEYAPNGSVDTYLNKNKDPRALCWQTRIRIATEICSVLIFLHSIKPHGIAHGDIKPSNILLDSNYSVKLSGFGFSHQLHMRDIEDTPYIDIAEICGTMGYMEPEFFSAGMLTAQSDVCAFGIVLLQLVTGRNTTGICSYAKQAVESERLESIIDSSAGNWPLKDAKNMILLGLRCQNLVRERRPDLATDILPILKSSLDVETRRGIEEKILEVERIEHKKLEKSKAALELQIANYMALLENARKQHEEHETTLQNEIDTTKKELIDTSVQHKCSLDMETQRRIEIEKTLEQERIKHQNVEESEAALKLQLVTSEDLLKTTKKQHEELETTTAVLMRKLSPLESFLKKETEQRIQTEKALERERIEHNKLEESKAALKHQLDKSNDLLETTKNEHKELETEKKKFMDTYLQTKDSLDMETHKRIKLEKTLKTNKLIQQNLKKSKAALELQLVGSRELLETTRKQHEELETSLRGEVETAKKELRDTSLDMTANKQLHKELESDLQIAYRKTAKLKKKLANIRIEQEKWLHSKAALEVQVEQSQIESVDTLKNVKEHMTTVIFREFSLAELEEATKNFDDSCKIGEGTFGIVFKGFLQCTNVAIKMLKYENSLGDMVLHLQNTNVMSESSKEDIEFNQEVEILTKVRHPNLVSLIGVNPNARALVFEFVPNSLDTFLTGGKNAELSWQYRIRIASEICSVLIFLHSVPPDGIAHGDLKPQNILLDSNFVSKLCDFGISRRLYRTDDTLTPLHLTTNPKYTEPYCAPEYFSSYELTPMFDIYSFGIILLQLVTGRNPIKIKNFVGEDLDSNNMDKIVKLDKLVVDPACGWPLKEAEELALLGMRCSHPLKNARPNLAQVVWPSLESMKRVSDIA